MTARNLLDDRRGVVMVEFLICFVPVFLLFLMGVQLALIAAGRLVVAHAAQRGARAAVVVLDDDPRHYDGARRGDVQQRPDASAGKLERGLAASLGPRLQALPSLGGPRIADIRRAAYVPLLALAQPGLLGAMLGASSVRRAIDGDLASRLLAGLVVTPALAAVTLPVAPGSDAHAGSQAGLGELVTVRVTYALPCLVPAVSRVMCDALDWDAPHGRLRIDPGADAARRRALAELREAPAADRQQMLALARVPFALLQAEVSLPTQRAPYLYPSEVER